ncbi:MAG: hypothetical protein J6C05_00250 [Prevotella sp.]|nr:hypothetical protein [Prevotella sp.]
MRKTAKEIIADVERHLANSKKKSYSNFYVGITNDVERRLFTEHNVDKNRNWWIYRTAINKATAQIVEEFFLNKGMQGDTGGGIDESIYVYCYEITGSTKE